METKRFAAISQKFNDHLPAIVSLFAILLITLVSYLTISQSYKSLKEQLGERARQVSSIKIANISNQISYLAAQYKREFNSAIIRSALADSQENQTELLAHLNSFLIEDANLSAVAVYDFIGRELGAAAAALEALPKHPAEKLLHVLKRGTTSAYLERNENGSESELFILVPILFPASASYEGVALLRLRTADFIKNNSVKNLHPEETIETIFQDSQKKVTPLTLNLLRSNPSIDFHRIEQLKSIDTFAQQIWIETRYKKTAALEKTFFITDISQILLLLGILSVAYFILGKWFSSRYVIPIQKIERFAKNYGARTGGHENPDGKTPGSLQALLENLISSLNESQADYRDEVLRLSQEIERNRLRLEEITKAGNIFVFSLDPHRKIIDYISANLRTITDAPPSSLDWKFFLKYLNNKNKKTAIQCLKNCLRHGSAVCSLQVEIRNTELIFETTLLKVGVGSTFRIDGIAIENTSAARNRISLEQSELQKRAIINSAFDGIILIDGEGIIRDCNPAAEYILGLRNFEVVGENFTDQHVAASYISIFRRQFNKLFENSFNQFSNLEIRIRQVNGNTKPVMLNGGTISANDRTQACLFIRDLSEDYRQKNAILLANREIQAILELSPDGFVSFDPAGFLKNFNTPALQILNWSKEFLTELKTENLFNAALLKVSELVSNTEAKKLKPNEKLLRIAKPKPKLIRCLISRSESATNKPVQSVYFFSDITEEFQLTTLKSNFLATAAHELRTPLTTILGFSELMNTQNLSEDVKKELNGSVFRNSVHLKNLLDDLLDLTKLESEGGNALKLKQANPIDILVNLIDRSCIKKDGAYFLKNHRVNLHVTAETPCTMMIDSDKLTRSYQNILSNSEKYSHPDSTITININRILKNEKSFLKFDFIDQGIGMTPDELSHVFARFWRADSTSGKIPGTGLGLSLCKQIIELHNGQIQINSEYGKGTTVSLYLPV